MSQHGGSGRPGQLDAARQSVRLADEGACVPWAAMASIERATRDAAERHAASAIGAEGPVRSALSSIRRRSAAWRARGVGRAR